MSMLDCHGQNSAIDRLQRALRSGRISHSYVFYGPEGVGKKLLAIEWAKRLLCKSPIRRTPPEEPAATQYGRPQPLELDDCCDWCPDCKLVISGTHPDLHIVNRAMGRYARKKRTRKLIDLPIDVIREFVIAPAGMQPSRGRARIFIIDESETLNRQSQNALLKTLEEPPKETFIIMVSSRVDLLLPTVRSRCQFVRFTALDVSIVYDRLIESGLHRDEAEYWSGFCGGRLGLAIELGRLGLYNAKEELLEQLAGLEQKTALVFADWLVKQAKQYGTASKDEEFDDSETAGVDLLDDIEIASEDEKSDDSEPASVRQIQNYFLQMIAYEFRSALRLAAARRDETPIAARADQKCLRLADSFGVYGCSMAIRHTVTAERQLAANVNPSLLFESLMLNYTNSAEAGVN